MRSAEALSRLVVVDVETSGLNPFRHQILSLAVVPLDHAKPTLELYVRDGEPEWQRAAAQYFGTVRRKWEVQGQSPREVCGTLASYIQDVFGAPVTMAGHNVGFDVAFLRQLAFRAGLDELPMISHRAIDTHTMLFMLYMIDAVPSSALSSDGAFHHFGINTEPTQRHTARGDAVATRELVIRILELWNRVSASL